MEKSIEKEFTEDRGNTLRLTYGICDIFAVVQSHDSFILIRFSLWIVHRRIQLSQTSRAFGATNSYNIG